MYDSDMKKIMLKHKSKRLTRGEAIRIYCKEMCCAGDYQSWRNCNFPSCTLYPFRMGRESKGIAPIKEKSFLKEQHTVTETKTNISSGEGSA